MAILIGESGRLFHLQTRDGTYQMYADEHGVLLHTYYGRKIQAESVADLIFRADVGFSGNPPEAAGDRTYSLDCLPQELPSCGVGDYREESICIRHEDGSMAADFRYAGYEIRKGAYRVPGLPALHDDGHKSDTLIITLREKASGVVAHLYYGVFEEENVITRTIRVENHGGREVVLERCLSVCLDFQYGEYDFIAFCGRHAMERNLERTPVRRTKLEVGSPNPDS